MALVSETLARVGPCSVTVEYDSVTRVISLLSWTIPSGTLTVVVRRSGKPEITRSVTTSGSQVIPGNYSRDTNVIGAETQISWEA